MKTDARRVAVLVSGRGSNLKALIDNASGYEIVLVASNKPQAQALEVARAAGLPAWAFEGRGVAREDYDAMLSRSLQDHCVGTIALAGYMRILTPAFVKRWRGRIINIHPSLLPKYRGLDTHQRALDAGETMAGCSVHVVTEDVDGGDILAQVELPIEPGDDAVSLAHKVLEAEHDLYPATLAEFVKR